MNFNIGGPSNLSSSSSSSDEEEEAILVALGAMDAEEEEMIAQYGQFQHAMAQYLNQQNNPVRRGGSIPGHIVINRDRESVDRRLFYDYFTENPQYNDQMFRRRFRMDSVGRLGLSALQKITTVFRMLAYGCPADATDEYIKIGESTTIESLKRFYRAIVEEFVGEYLRSPNATDVARLLRIGKDHGFLGMLGSLDCMHWN
ncbi:hypothetical protein Ddye_018480 [Dipteronia dyeriana]|uniref:Uncharacterized protein n=1 Tax=Dipteronia dyeriana TaxID=168575 RepID=A0AAD9UB49_9ROSI|nr:hypothetical protein Ddye_018480 [Dipteronia dyeriana]